MNFIQIRPNHIDFLQTFLEPYESSCVQLCSYIRKNQIEYFYAISLNEEIYKTDDIKGVIYFHNSLLCFFPDIDFLIQNNFNQDFIKFIEQKPLKNITGLQTSVDYLISILKEVDLNPSQQNYYNLLVLEQKVNPAPQSLINDETIIRCTENDINTLYDLQFDYLNSEVVPLGKKLTINECTLNLKMILKTQVVLALFTDGEPVSKANTNAIGWNWIQIGGVYTNPLFRRNYYSWQVLSALINRIQKANKKVCLFVKKKNQAANNLYAKLGFINKDNFEIAYFS